MNQCRNPQKGFQLPSWDEGLTREEKIQIMREINRKFYRRPSYLLRRVLEVRSWADFWMKARAGWVFLRGGF